MTVELHRGTGLVELLRVCFKLPADEREQYEAFTGERFSAEELAARLFVSPGPKWTVMAGDEPIMVAGFNEIRDGVWQDWAVTTPEAWTLHWRTVTKMGRRVMDEMLQSGAHRLQCVSLASRTQAHRWYRPLGLEQEGTLRGYGVNGEDAIMFSRLRTLDGHQQHKT